MLAFDNLEVKLVNVSSNVREVELRNVVLVKRRSHQNAKAKTVT